VIESQVFPADNNRHQQCDVSYACLCCSRNQSQKGYFILCGLVVQIERSIGSFTVWFYLGSSILLCGGKFKGNFSGLQRIQRGMPSGCWNRFWPWIHWEWSISPTHTLFYHMELYFGAIRTHITQTVFTKFKKRIIRIITNSGSRDTCRQLFKHFQILLLPSQYIFSPFVFVIKNRDFFQSNSEIHNLNTRFNRNLH